MTLAEAISQPAPVAAVCAGTNHEAQPRQFAGGRLQRNVGRRVRALRKSKDMTLADVANLIGSTPQSVQRLETGHMTISLRWVEALARALGVSPLTLLLPDEEDGPDALENFIVKEVDRRVAEVTQTLAAWLRDQATTLDPQPNS